MRICEQRWSVQLGYEGLTKLYCFKVYFFIQDVAHLRTWHKGCHSEVFSYGTDSVQVAECISSRHGRCHPCILATIRCCKGCNISVYCSLICTCIHQQASHHYSLSCLVSNWNTIWRHHQFSELGIQAIWYITLYVCMRCHQRQKKISTVDCRHTRRAPGDGFCLFTIFW